LAKAHTQISLASTMSKTGSSSALTGFLFGSAATATVILVYQNRQSILNFYRDIIDEINEEENHDHREKDGQRGIALDLQKIKSTMHLTNNKQTEFLSEILEQLWPYINIAGSDTIRNTAEPMFKEMMPGPLSTLHFTKIDLGTIPIRMDNIDIKEVNLEENCLQFDMDLVWDSQSDIKLKADYIGSFGVKSIKMRGRMSILMRPLVPTTSVVSGIQYGFINTPELSLKYSGLAHLADFKVIDQTIQEILQASVNSMMVLPRRMLYKMDRACDYVSIYAPPLGVARITVVSGRGFEIEKGFLNDDIPDCYCVVSMGDLKHKTSTIRDNLEPEWNETLDFLLSDKEQVVKLQCWDEDEGPLDPDDDLGAAATTPSEIIEAGNQLELALQEDDEPKGSYVTLGCEILKFTSNLESLSDTNNRHLCGLLTIIVQRAYGIPLSKETASTFVEVTCGSSTFATSAVYDYPGVDCLNPFYDCAFLIELTPERVVDGEIADIQLNLINGTDTKLGILVLSHEDIVGASNNTLAETRSIGTKGAKLQFNVSLQGVESTEKEVKTRDLLLDPTAGDAVWADVAHDLEEAGLQKSDIEKIRTPLANVVNPQSKAQEPSASRGIAPSLDQVETDSFEDAAMDQGLLRVTAVSGKGFQVRKTPFFMPNDMPDVYLKITFGSSPQVWRTKTIENNIFPVWNEHRDFPLASHGQVIDIGVYEEDSKKGDNPCYGSVRVTVGKMLLAGGTLQQEILKDGQGTSAFITVRCELV